MLFPFHSIKPFFSFPFLFLVRNTIFLYFFLCFYPYSPFSFSIHSLPLLIPFLFFLNTLFLFNKKIQILFFKPKIKKLRHMLWSLSLFCLIILSSSVLFVFLLTNKLYKDHFEKNNNNFIRTKKILKPLYIYSHHASAINNIVVKKKSLSPSLFAGKITGKCSKINGCRSLPLQDQNQEVFPEIGH